MNDRTEARSDKAFFGGASALVMIAVGLVVFGMYGVAASSGVSYFAILAVVASSAFFFIRAIRARKQR